jgi:hypothetical protein
VGTAADLRHRLLDHPDNLVAILKKSKNKPVKPPKYPHARKMKLRHLYDDEYYLVSLSAFYHGSGGKPVLIKGSELKKSLWWRGRVATFPLIHKDHWIRFQNVLPPTNRPKTVEVLLPRKYRNFKGRRMVMFVEPWYYSAMRKKFKLDSDFRALIKLKYLV